MFKTLRQGMYRLFAPAVVHLKYWQATREIKDPVTFQVPIASLEGEVYMVTMSGIILKSFSWVELNLMFGTRFSDDHLFAFYDGVITLAANGDLTQPNLLMFLHPEAYVSETEFVLEPELLLLADPLAAESFEGEDDNVASDDDEDDRKAA